MAQEQTAIVGEPIEVLVNVIGSAGTHEAATINTTTTRIDGYPSTTPSVTTVATGIYRISFSGVTPAPAEGDRLTVKVNGTVTSTSTAWSEYGIPVKILAEERGTDNASTFNAASDQVTVSTNNDKTGYSISGIKQTLDSLNDIAATDIVSSGAITTSGGAVSNVTTVATTTSNSDMRGTDNAILASAAPTNFGLLGINGSGHISRVTLVDTTTTNTDMVSVSNLATASDLSVVDGVVDAIKVVTDRLDTALVIDGSVYQFTTNALENAPSGSGGGDSKEDIYNYFTSSSRQDTFRADVSSLSTFDASTDQVTASNMRGTDNAFLAANAPSNFASLGINGSGHVTRVTLVDSNTDMRGTDGANTVAPDNAGITANGAAINALNNLSDQDVENAVWDSSYSAHVQAGTFGKLMDLLRKANRAIDAEVDGTPTASAFDTNLSGYVDGAFDHELVVFTSGALNGEARPILSYSATNGRITFEEPLTAAPSASDEFVILPYHTTPTSEIQDGLVTIGTQFTYTNQAGDSHQVTIS